MRQFKNPANQAASKQIGFTSGEKKRLVVMAIALAFVVTAIGYSWFRAQQLEQPANLPLEVALTERVAIPKLDVAALESMVRDERAEQRVLLEGPAVDAMLHHVRLLTPAHFDALGTKPLDPALRADVMAHPSTHRGDAFLVRGWLKELRARRRGPTAPEEFHGRIVDDLGAVTYFITLTAPERLIPDVDFVRLDGRFLKVFSEENPETPGRWDDGPLLVGSTLVHSWQAIEPVAELDKLMLLQEVEHDRLVIDEGLPRIATHDPPFDALWHTMAWARDGSATVDWANAPELDEKLVYQLSQTPDEFVGQPFRFPVCRLQGVRVRRASENPARLEEFTEGWLGNNTWKNVVHFWTPIPDRDLALLDYVRVNGVFLRNFAYDSKGQGVQIAPLFVVTSIESFVPEGDPLFRNMAVGIAVGSIVLTLLFVVLLQRDRKRAKATQDAMIAKRRERRAAGKLPTPGNA